MSVNPPLALPPVPPPSPPPPPAPSAAAINGLATDILKDLECPATMMPMTRPVTLPCGHHVDKITFDSLVARRENKCCECRRDFRGGVLNIQMQNLARNIPILFQMLGIGDGASAPAVGSSPGSSDLPADIAARVLAANQEGYQNGLREAERTRESAILAARNDGLREGHRRSQTDTEARVGEAFNRGYQRGVIQGAQEEQRRAARENQQKKTQETFFQRVYRFTAYGFQQISAFFQRIYFSVYSIFFGNF